MLRQEGRFAVMTSQVTAASTAWRSAHVMKTRPHSSELVSEEGTKVVLSQTKSFVEFDPEKNQGFGNERP
jgi:hypothetical protein